MLTPPPWAAPPAIRADLAPWAAPPIGTGAAPARGTSGDLFGVTECFTSSAGGVAGYDARCPTAARPLPDRLPDQRTAIL